MTSKQKVRQEAFPFPTARNHGKPPGAAKPREQPASEEALDNGVEESFPASDPVSVTVTKVVMPSAPGTKEAAEGIVDRILTFSYRDCLFRCGTRRVDDRTYEPVVFCVDDGHGTKEHRLPSDTDNAAYGSEEEALRHAEQQAMRWVHDRIGDGQGQA